MSVAAHAKIGFANPFLICDTCGIKVSYWHDPDRCGCNGLYFNYPCGHDVGITSICPTWNTITGCECVNKETHDKE